MGQQHNSGVGQGRIRREGRVKNGHAMDVGTKWRDGQW